MTDGLHLETTPHIYYNLYIQLYPEDAIMKSYLIKDTTREEREEIVAESLGNISAYCDGCSAGLAEMYQDYIDGKKELREINMEFNARYVSGSEGPSRGSCMMN